MLHNNIIATPTFLPCMHCSGSQPFWCHRSPDWYTLDLYLLSCRNPRLIRFSYSMTANTAKNNSEDSETNEHNSYSYTFSHWANSEIKIFPIFLGTHLGPLQGSPRTAAVYITTFSQIQTHIDYFCCVIHISNKYISAVGWRGLLWPVNYSIFSIPLMKRKLLLLL